MRILLVGLGGFLGAVLRYWFGSLVQSAFGGRFPLGTLAVNVLGCFCIGVLMGWMEFRQSLSPEVRLFAAVGVLGGFTTFSTFSYDTVELLRAISPASALLNLIASLALGLTATWLGLLLVRSLS